MHIVQVLPQSANGQHGAVGDEFAFGENKVPQTWSRVDDPLDSIILDAFAGRQVQDTQALKYHTLREF